MFNTLAGWPSAVWITIASIGFVSGLVFAVHWSRTRRSYILALLTTFGFFTGVLLGALADQAFIGGLIGLIVVPLLLRGVIRRDFPKEPLGW